MSLCLHICYLYTIKTKRKAKQSRAKQKLRQRQLTRQNAIMKSYSLLCLISFELYAVRKLRSLSVFTFCALPLDQHALSLTPALNLADVQSTEGIPCWVCEWVSARTLSHPTNPHSSALSRCFALTTCGYLSLELCVWVRVLVGKWAHVRVCVRECVFAFQLSSFITRILL